MSSPGAELRTGPLGLQTDAPTMGEDAFARLWQAFMTARVGIAGTLLVAHGVLYGIAKSVSTSWGVTLCVVYLTATLVVRLLMQPSAHGPRYQALWRYTIPVDILVYAVLDLLQIGSFNYTPLFALPILLASLLGSLRLAVGTAACITLFLLFDAWWTSLAGRVDVAAHFVQAGVTGAACCILALLVHQLAVRLLRVELHSRLAAAAARLQRQVNELVIESLGDGVLVVDVEGKIRVANPAALELLGPKNSLPQPPFPLSRNPGWVELTRLAEQTFRRQSDQRQELSVQFDADNTRRLQVRTRLTPPQSDFSENLCVMFLQDLRAMEARLRTEKLAAMGRMSTAVAHEIRNPLAAIVQANELLSEDLDTPGHKRLTSIVRQNTERLGRIVSDVLNVAHVRQQDANEHLSIINLDETVGQVCGEWSLQKTYAGKLLLDAQAEDMQVFFDTDHLRRVLINLLDNAARYGQPKNQPIRVRTEVLDNGPCVLRVWSEGAPLEKPMQQHLFEPFFTSESRSSGLGLYICRELCERHQAQIVYGRAARRIGPAASLQGNEFSITFRAAPRLEEPGVGVSFRPSTF